MPGAARGTPISSRNSFLKVMRPPKDIVGGVASIICIPALGTTPIGKGELRNRRNHEIRHVKARLLALDYILAHSENEYFETAESKRRYFAEVLKVPEEIFWPETDESDSSTFPDRFSIGVSRASGESAPVLTFTHVASEPVGLGLFIKHLSSYRRLLAALLYFQFVYVSTASKEQDEAAEIFALLIQGRGLADLLRYFELKTKWDNKQYGQLSDKGHFP